MHVFTVVTRKTADFSDTGLPRIGDSHRIQLLSKLPIHLENLLRRRQVEGERIEYKAG